MKTESQKTVFSRTHVHCSSSHNPSHQADMDNLNEGQNQITDEILHHLSKADERSFFQSLAVSLQIDHFAYRSVTKVSFAGKADQDLATIILLISPITWGIELWICVIKRIFSKSSSLSWRVRWLSYILHFRIFSARTCTTIQILYFRCCIPFMLMLSTNTVFNPDSEFWLVGFDFHHEHNSKSQS